MNWPWKSSASRRNDQFGTPVPLPWWRRNWMVLAAVLIIVVGLGVWKWYPQDYPCGANSGLIPQGKVCVGLDLNSSRLTVGGTDPLGNLEKILQRDNGKIGDNSTYATIVYLDDLEPNKAYDTVNPTVLKHRVEGEIAAEEKENSPAAAGASQPKIKVLLANYGNNADQWNQAVGAIESNAAKQHIVAVTGIGQSVAKAKSAIESLSRHRIMTVGSVTSGDSINSMDQDPANQSEPQFYRVTPTNQNLAAAIVSYIGRRYKRIMLVKDDNAADEYTSDLAQDFSDEEASKNHTTINHVEMYGSLRGPLSGSTRSQNMADRFDRDMKSDMCSYKPDLIYFAGRGVDLSPFLSSIGDAASCGLNKVDVISGDDANTMVGVRWPSLDGVDVQVFYAAVAARNEWVNAKNEGDIDPQDYSLDSRDYEDFFRVFTQAGRSAHDSADFSADDLTDGHAIMEYDSLITVANTVQQDPSVVKNPGLLAGDFENITCEDTKSIPGASGRIAFYGNGRPLDKLGNPIDKPVPIMKLDSGGNVSQQALEWSDYNDFYSSAECGGKS